MFTFGWSEIFLIGIIVVVVIGPKDLPKFIKQVGSFTKYIKKMSSEFKSSSHGKRTESFFIGNELLGGVKYGTIMCIESDGAFSPLK